MFLIIVAAFFIVVIIWAMFTCEKREMQEYRRIIKTSEEMQQEMRKFAARIKKEK